MIRTKVMAALMGAVATGACEGGSPTQEPAPPAGVVATWRVTHVRDAAVPGLLYLFDPDIVDGREVSAHFVLDSAELVIRANGQYEHRIRVTQWLGEPGGPPVERTLQFFHGDYGYWTRTGDDLAFESNYLQNHRMTGSMGVDGVLHMQHGFTHGDPPVALRYGRNP